MVLDCASAKEGKTIVPAASANAPAIIISAVRTAFIGNLQQPHPRGNRDTQAGQSHHVSAMLRAQTKKPHHRTGAVRGGGSQTGAHRNPASRGAKRAAAILKATLANNA